MRSRGCYQLCSISNTDRQNYNSSKYIIVTEYALPKRRIYSMETFIILENYTINNDPKRISSSIILRFL